MKLFKVPPPSSKAVFGFTLKLAERCQTCKSLPLAPVPRGVELLQKEEERPKLSICCIKWELCGPWSTPRSFQPHLPCTTPPLLWAIAGRDGSSSFISPSSLTAAFLEQSQLPSWKVYSSPEWGNTHLAHSCQTKPLNSPGTLLGEKPPSCWLPLLQQKLLLDWGPI